jgi:MFS family permease
MLQAGVPVTLVLTMSWFGVYTFINAYYTRGLGKSNAEWTALTLWFNGSMMLWPFVCVRLVAWIGHRRLTTAALGLCAVLYLLTAFAHTKTEFSAIVTLMAIVPSVLAVAWLPVVIEAGHSRPGRAIASYTLISTIVGACALIAGGGVLAAAGYRPMFLAMSAAAAVCTLVFYPLSARLPAPPPVRVGLLAIPRRDLMKFARGPVAFLLLAGVCIEPFNFHAANQLFPNLARDVHGLSAGAIGGIVALGRLPALVSLFVLARIVDEVPITRFYGAGLMLAGVCVCCTASAGATGWLIAAYCGYYLFHGAVWGTNTAAINAAVEPRQREYAMAITTSVSTGATFAVGVVHNRLLTAGMSLPGVIHLSGAIGAVAGVVMICYSFTRFAAWSRPS